MYILSELASRRPPNIAPNWKTSYRLKCSALVAVVRLGSSGEALGSTHPLQWAEVVPCSQTFGADQDFQQRAKGKLALRPLTKADVGALDESSDGAAMETSLLQVGGRVAVIDLRVFVPEVVSVLGTLFQPRLQSQLEHIPFVHYLMGNEAPPPALLLGAEATCEAAITNAIHTSEMDVLLRLSAPVRDSLCADLVALGLKSNLYGTQLESFCEALRCSLHCTQGPPGTGKVRHSIFVGSLLTSVYSATD